MTEETASPEVENADEDDGDERCGEDEDDELLPSRVFRRPGRAESTEEEEGGGGGTKPERLAERLRRSYGGGWRSGWRRRPAARRSR